MSNAQARGWGNPDGKGYRAAHIVTITLNCGVRLHVRREVAHLFKGFFDELEQTTGYSLADQGQPDDWGYNNRDIRGRPGVKSNHAWGLAVDANAEENPMRDALVTNMPPETAALAAKWGLRWGASYTGRKDAMHFEFEGTPDDVHKYPTSAATPKPAPEPTPKAQAAQEDDMPFIANPVTDTDPGMYFVNGDKYCPLATDDEKQQLLNSGFTKRDLEPLAWALYKATATEIPHP